MLTYREAAELVCEAWELGKDKARLEDAQYHEEPEQPEVPQAVRIGVKRLADQFRHACEGVTAEELACAYFVGFGGTCDSCRVFDDADVTCPVRMFDEIARALGCGA